MPKHYSLPDQQALALPSDTADGSPLARIVLDPGDSAAALRVREPIWGPAVLYTYFHADGSITQVVDPIA